MAITHPSFQDQPYGGPVREVGPWQIAFHDQNPAASAEGTPLVFAHGKRDDWGVWQQSGTLDFVAAAGHRALAVDLPPAGNFSNTRTKGPCMADPVVFWRNAMEHFGIDQPIGVFPDQSGPDIGYPIVRRQASLLSGVVLVAPTRIEQFAFSASDVPALILWGTADEVITPDHATTAAQSFANNTVARIEKAGHNPFLSQPEACNVLLVEFSRDPQNFRDRLGDLALQGVELSTS